MLNRLFNIKSPNNFICFDNLTQLVNICVKFIQYLPQLKKKKVNS